MVPTAPEPGLAAAPAGERLSPEAAWGMRALIMVLMFLLRWFGSGATPSADEVTGPVDGLAVSSHDHQAERAQRVAKSTAGATAHQAPTASPTPAVAVGADAMTAANRRRALYASALTAAGTAAWVAGRRSGGRR